MLLTPIKGIRDSLGFDDMTDINDAISTALHAAESQIASLLGTTFDRGQYTDVFWVPEPVFQDRNHVSTEFRLSRGLLASAPTISMAVDVKGTGASDLSGEMKVDLDKGIAKDWSTWFNRHYVTFEYEAGFEPDDGDPDSYKDGQVPPWLQEAAKLKALVHLASNPSLTEAGVSLDEKVLDAQFASLINRHLRYAPMALLPL